MLLRLHRWVLSVEGDARAVEAAGELLAGLPEAPSGAAPHLRIVLRAAPPQPRPPTPRLFHHGIVECHADREDLLVWDGASRARVVAGGGLLEADVADASLADGYLFAHVFLLVALILALRWRGLFHLHAGALVAPDGRGILVAGDAGAGKSTLTVALLEAGCDYLGDDAVFVASGAAGGGVLALHRPFHLAPATAAAFPRLAPLLSERLRTGDKRGLDPRRAWPGRERDAMADPELILLPRVAGAEKTRIEPVSAGDGLGALIESSTLVVVDGLPSRSDHLAVLARIADGARTLRVESGSDLLDRPADAARGILDVAERT